VGHDLASNVARFAGLELAGAEGEPWPPSVLFERFCGDEAAGLRADPGVVTEDRGGGLSWRVGRGWCGFNGHRSPNRLLTGFDDGYDFMGCLAEHGWGDLPSRGDWPYIVYMVWTKDGKPALCSYQEADFTCWEFDTAEQMREFISTLPECP
jgi:hypothetical protein